MGETKFRSLSLHFWSDLGEDVNVVVCYPTPATVVGLLDCLSSLCTPHAPPYLSHLALSCLRPATELPPSSPTWYVVDEKTLTPPDEDAGLVKNEPLADVVASLWCQKDDLVASDDFLLAQAFAGGTKKRKAKAAAGRGTDKTKSVPSGSEGGDKKSIKSFAHLKTRKKFEITPEVRSSSIRVKMGKYSRASDRKPSVSSWKSGTKPRAVSPIGEHKLVINAAAGEDVDGEANADLKFLTAGDNEDADDGNLKHCEDMIPDCDELKEDFLEQDVPRTGHAGNDSPEPSALFLDDTYSYPDAQEMLDRFAFRRKTVKKGVHCSVCPDCGRTGYTEMTLRQHLQAMHKYVACKACRQLFAGDGSHTCPLQNIACDKCPKRFNSLDGWKLHQKKVHRGVRYVCHVCGRQLADVNSLRTHLEVRHGIMPPPPGRGKQREPRVPPSCHFCHKCGKQVKNRYSLREHERRIHGGSYRSAPCKFCSRIFCSGFSLKRHMASVHRSQLAAAAETSSAAVRKTEETAARLGVEMHQEGTN